MNSNRKPILIDGEPSEAGVLPEYKCALCGSVVETSWVDVSTGGHEIALARGGSKCINKRCVNYWVRCGDVKSADEPTVVDISVRTTRR
jgi:hypothetical protein